MATKHFCDGCDTEFHEGGLTKFQFLDGEHPHNGSRMERTVDLCLGCMSQIYRTPKASIEFDEFLQVLKGNRRAS